jgi:hypothetical protein
MAEPVAQREDPPDSPELCTLRRRAYDELELAIDLSNGELPAEWLTKGDRDLEAVRDEDNARWKLLVRRVSWTKDPKDLPLPQPAWGDLHRRREELAGLAVLLFWLAIALLALFLPVVVVALGAIVIAGVAAYVAAQILPRALVLVAGGIVLALVLAAFLALVLPLWAKVAAVLFGACVASGVAWRLLADQALKRDTEDEKRKRKDEQADKGEQADAPGG